MLHRRFVTGSLILAFVLAGAAVCWAKPHPHHPRSINARQDHQQGRIHQGSQSGELTRRETFRLESQQAALRKKEAVYRADGVLTPREKRDLQTDQNRLSRNIDRQKHDKQSRKD